MHATLELRALKFILSVSTLISFVKAHGHHHHHLHRDVHLNARGQPYGTGPEYAVPTPIESIVATDPGYNENTLPVASTWPAFSQPTLLSAPPIPAFVYDPSKWPKPDHLPPTNSPEVQGWLQELNGHLIPDYAPNLSTDCGNSTVAESYAARGSEGRCWWTCGGCTRPVDLTFCNDEKWSWGIGFDDGPGLYTDKLLAYLDSKDIKATFYVVGSRVIDRPQVLQYEYMTGHQIAVHTWSHPSLTTLTTEEIVAELGWTRKAIKDVTGVTPLFMRPPFGDIDDRVRAISLAMGLIPVIWTSTPTPNENDADLLIQWDSQDWKVHGGGVLSGPNQQTFEATLDSSGQFDHGVIVLQHDIYVESVNLAIGYTIPYALNHDPPFTLKSVINCQGRPLEDAYLETNTNKDSPAVKWEGDISTKSSNVGEGTFTSGISLGTGTIIPGPSQDYVQINQGSHLGAWLSLVLTGIFGSIVGAFLIL